MQVKKNPKIALKNFSRIFLLIGLVLALFITHLLLEHKTYERTIVKKVETIILSEKDYIEDLVVTYRPQKKIIRRSTLPPPPPPEAVDVITVVENDVLINESPISSTETDETEAVEGDIDLDAIYEIGEPEIIIEDVPFAVIESVPVFPGCKGNKEELKKCFSKRVNKHINKKFNVSLANSLGLTEGIKRIFVVFTINHNGDIVDIKSRAPHPRLEKEAARVVQTLPKMTPGKQRNKPVNVQYSVPITFKIINK